MKQILTTCIAVGILGLMASMALAQENWPTWRGAHNTGAALTGNPPVVLDEAKNLKWKVPILGQTQSTPVVWQDQLFYQTVLPVEGSDAFRFEVVCLNRQTGQTLWQTTACQAVPHEKHHRTASFASFSPVTDGRKLWVNFGSRGLYCYDLEGRLQWQKDLFQMKIRGAFGEASSPCLAGNAVVVVCDQEDQSMIFAFQKDSGDLLWRKDRDEASNWTTPVAVEVEGKMQVIVGGKNAILAYEASTGDVIWSCRGQTGNVIPTPVVGDGVVFCISGFQGSALQAIELGHTGDLTDTDAVLWSMSDGTPYVPSPVLLDNRLFFCASRRNQGIVSCYDVSTGRPLYSQQRLAGINMIYASFTGLKDRLYIAGRNGGIVVLKNSDSFVVLSTAKFDEEFDASPVIVGNDLYLKGNHFLYCFSE